MEYTEKMYLVPQRQLDKIKSDSRPLPLRQRVENTLDSSMRTLLDRTDLHPNAKVKEYTAILQRFLTLAKLGDSETNTLTLSLPPEPHTTTNESVEQKDVLSTNVMASEVVNNLPPRSKKNANYILNKMQGMWDENTGAFIYEGKPLAGTHIYDLVKVATGNHYVGSRQTPTGWHEFMTTVSQLNIPMSFFPNKKLQGELRTMKSPYTTPRGTDTMTPRSSRPTPHTPHSHRSKYRMDRTDWDEF